MFTDGGYSMEKIAFITDSGCGHSIDEMKRLGIFSLPLQISIENKNYFDIETLSTADVILALKNNESLATSQPALGLVDHLFASLKDNGYTKAIAVPICPGLSGTMNALYLAADQNDIELHCVDCGVTAVLEKYLIEYIKNEVEKKGTDIREAIKKAEAIANSANTLLVPTDMHHLVKSGRLSKAGAVIADFLLIKPILEISRKTEGKIVVSSKTRTFKKALLKALNKMKEEIDSDDYLIVITHVDAYGDALIFENDVKKVFPENRIEVMPLHNPVAVHVGLGCIAIQYFKVDKELSFEV